MHHLDPVIAYHFWLCASVHHFDRWWEQRRNPKHMRLRRAGGDKEEELSLPFIKDRVELHFWQLDRKEELSLDFCKLHSRDASTFQLYTTPVRVTVLASHFSSPSCRGISCRGADEPCFRSSDILRDSL